jgi:DNA topoisomerase I
MASERSMPAAAPASVNGTTPPPAPAQRTSALRRAGARRARKVGLRYVNGYETGIRRRRCGNGFSYVSATGRTIRSQRERKRIGALAIPPAWQDVWICPTGRGHIQAMGRDADGRLQYIYHERWQAVSAATKYDRMHLMAELLPRIRRRVRRDLAGKALTQERVLAAVVRLLDKAHLRIGNQSYARQHGSRGATTLTPDHVEVDRFRISLAFPGKSGKEQEIEFHDEKTARVIRQCEEVDGQFLFCYHNGSGRLHAVDSTEVNAYLREISEQSITAKDFRTWWGSVIALAALTGQDERQLSPTARRKAIVAAVAETAEALGNTPAVCRSSYIHPAILAAFETGELSSLNRRAAANRSDTTPELTIDEHRFARLLPRLGA